MPSTKTTRRDRKEKNGYPSNSTKPTDDHNDTLSRTKSTNTHSPSGDSITDEDYFAALTSKSSVSLKSSYVATSSSHHRHHHRHKSHHHRHLHHRRHKSRHQSTCKCLGYHMAFDRNYLCMLITFSISLSLLAFECYLFCASIEHNQPPFMSFTLNNDEHTFTDTYTYTHSDDIDPTLLYHFTYNEIYAFRDELVANKQTPEVERVYLQNTHEGYLDSDHVMDIHSEQYYRQYQSMHGHAIPDTDSCHEGSDEEYVELVDGYVFDDSNIHLFQRFYEYVFSEHALLYMIIKNILGFLIIVLSILSPSNARKIYFLMFTLCSMINSFFAFTNPNIYLTFTKTAISWYRNAMYPLYVPHNTRMLVVLAFVQHCVASMMYLKNASYVYITARRKRRERKKSRKYIKRRTVFRIPCQLYGICVFLGCLNFAALIPMGVDWNEYGMIKFSSSSVSFTFGLIVLFLAHYGFLIDADNPRRHKRKSSSKHNKEKEPETKEKEKEKEKKEEEESKEKEPDSSVSSSAAPKAITLTSGANSSGSTGGATDKSSLNNKSLKEILNDVYLRDIGKEEEEEKKQVELEQTVKVKEETKKNGHVVDEEEKEKKEENGKRKKKALILFAHFDGEKFSETKTEEIEFDDDDEDGEAGKHKRIKLGDGTVIKCKCDECRLRRERRRNERKRLRILQSMERCKGEAK